MNPDQTYFDIASSGSCQECACGVMASSSWNHICRGGVFGVSVVPRTLFQHSHTQTCPCATSPSQAVITQGQHSFELRDMTTSSQQYLELLSSSMIILQLCRAHGRELQTGFSCMAAKQPPTLSRAEISPAIECEQASNASCVTQARF